VYEIFIDGKQRKIELTRTEENSFKVKVDDRTLNVELPTGKLDLKRVFSIKIGDKTYKIELSEISRGKPFDLKVEEVTFKAEVKVPVKRAAGAAFDLIPASPMTRAVTRKQIVEGAVTAPMTGKILSVMVKKEDKVKAGQILCVLEAMKMENEITAPKSGIVQEVHVSEGSSVSEGEVLFVLG